MKQYTVATFVHPRPGMKVCLSRIAAYTRWFNEQWPGCIVYEVEADSGAAAKAKAKAMRLEHEVALERGE